MRHQVNMVPGKFSTGHNFTLHLIFTMYFSRGVLFRPFSARDLDLVGVVSARAMSGGTLYNVYIWWWLNIIWTWYVYFYLRPQLMKNRVLGIIEMPPIGFLYWVWSSQYWTRKPRKILDNWYSNFDKLSTRWYNFVLFRNWMIVMTNGETFRN